jgi:hypothetical protein
VLDSDDEEVVQVPSPCVVGVAAAPSAKATDALNDLSLLLSVVEGVVVSSPLRAVVVPDTTRPVDAWDAPTLSACRRTTSLMLLDEAGTVMVSTSLGATDNRLLLSMGDAASATSGSNYLLETLFASS